jgi:hypothetical protein
MIGCRRSFGARIVYPVLALSFLLPRVLGAQETGRIVGRVLDAGTGEGLSGVVVRLAGADHGVLSGVGGRYVLVSVPAGVIALHFESLGYAAKTITQIAVPADGTVEQDVTLEETAVALDAIEVSAAAERGSVARALDEQRTSAAIVNAVSAEQIRRSPDSDAAAAIQRVSGVTVQDGKYVHVRGLGERYTTTSLNGARIPSPEPERRIVPLDLFPSALLETITTSKTFTPDQPGDFTGAQVDIRTREFAAGARSSWSLGIGYNDGVTGRSAVAAPTAGMEWLAFGGSERRLPAEVRAAGSFDPPPSQAEMNRMVGAFRNAWSARQATAAPNVSAALSTGGAAAFGGHDVAYLATGTYARNQEIRADEVRSLALAGPDGTTAEIDRYRGSTGRSTVLWGGLLNLSTLLGERSRIALSSTYNRTADNEARVETGTSENHGELPLRVERLRFVERSVLSSRLAGQHEIGSRQRLDWALSASAVDRNEPDRSEIVYAIHNDPATGERLPPAWFSASNEGAVRTFGALAENTLEASADYRIELGSAGSQHALKLGALVRLTDRDADNRALSISAGRLSAGDRQRPPEEIFDGRFSSPGDDVFTVTPLGQGGAYGARDRLGAAFAMVDVALSDRLRWIAGARIEHSAVEVTAEPTIGAPLVSDETYTDVLPALSVNVQLGHDQYLRFSATRTLSRPEYRELAGVQYREVLGGDNVLGNPDLRRALIGNADVRWEWYPAAGEVLAVSAFAKRFSDPIERVYLATSGTRVITFLNAEGANTVGIELEARKRLGPFARILEPWTIFANATLMRSTIRIGEGQASVTSEERTMVGQAPYVVNAGLTYASGSGATSATVLYNVIGRRIVSAAEAPLPDVYEQPRHVLDLAFRFPLTAALSARIDAKNLLDDPFEVTQGAALREFYRAGRVFSVGLSLTR